MSEQNPSMEDLRKVIREELRPLWSRIERHDREIYGHNGTPGLTTLVDANTRHSQRVTWHIRSVWTAFLGSVVSGITWVIWR